MKKKIIIGIIAAVILAGGAFLAFKLYLKYNKANSEVEKSETTINGTQEKTNSGVTLNNFDHLSGTYKSEKATPPTSEILFQTYGTTATQGTFKEIEISAEFNGINQTSIQVVIDVTSIYTAESTRDKHLKGEEFFNTDKFSKITFSSNEIIKGDTSYIAKGDISFLGNTKSLEIPFVYNGSANNKENTEVFEGRFDFNPEKYGMESDAGDNVTITFYTELKKQ